MKPKIIKTDTEHEAALAHIETLMDAEPGSEEQNELELWSLLVEQYEQEHYPIDPPDPVEAIRFRMDQMGIKAKDLVKYMSAKSKVSEVLNRKRGLSLSMIRALHSELGIPAEVLVREPKLITKKKTGIRRRIYPAKKAKKGAPAKRKSAQAIGKRKTTHA